MRQDESTEECDGRKALDPIVASPLIGVKDSPAPGPARPVSKTNELSCVVAFYDAPPSAWSMPGMRIVSVHVPVSCRLAGCGERSPEPGMTEELETGDGNENASLEQCKSHTGRKASESSAICARTGPDADFFRACMT